MKRKETEITDAVKKYWGGIVLSRVTSWVGDMLRYSPQMPAEAAKQ